MTAADPLPQSANTKLTAPTRTTSRSFLKLILFSSMKNGRKIIIYDRYSSKLIRKTRISLFALLLRPLLRTRPWLKMRHWLSFRRCGSITFSGAPGTFESYVPGRVNEKSIINGITCNPALDPFFRISVPADFLVVYNIASPVCPITFDRERISNRRTSI
ncbi:bifunctional biotin operon repressor/biotin synthetase BirA [Corchorus capsularis]|uniref:Bifunctional biotin operon repressor/biotin synthetase BirA n=1 Tax=Corchorus capsularis TaxID=210143 RepID=A0A1R3K8X1_COCAP|nr:bifunctional biotin operon repressor/biotin synthetase BirA [Corchorus capsularis]OMP03532.1 bifunctional biotin operon repressor/biotin synthetase BirA [Corchorus capsularis]